MSTTIPVNNPDPRQPERDWRLLGVVEIMAENQSVAEYVASLESRLEQSKKLYGLTLDNQLRWMRNCTLAEKLRDQWCAEFTRLRDKYEPTL